MPSRVEVVGCDGWLGFCCGGVIGEGEGVVCVECVMLVSGEGPE